MILVDKKQKKIWEIIEYDIRFILSNINKSIESGRYASASEVIRAGLRLLDEKEQQVELLREAIEDGEKSYVKNFDPVKHLEELNRKFKQSVQKASQRHPKNAQ